MQSFSFFFFNDPATTEIYTLSLHDALPILGGAALRPDGFRRSEDADVHSRRRQDRKSTRLNSSHRTISYAVFCLKKKKHDLRNPPARSQSDLRGRSHHATLHEHEIAD